MAKKSKNYSDEVKAKAINIVTEEKKNWENAEIFITERVAFRARDLIRTCYKNYWGVFDKPLDSLSGREKIWYPLSEEVANTWADNADLDTKDIGFRTRPGGEYAITQLTRQIMKDYLDQTLFGQDLDSAAFEKAITGTSVTKVVDHYKGKKNWPKRTQVNLLNFYIDPSAPNIQEAYRVTERALYFPDELARMTGWVNVSDLKAGQGLPNFDPELKKTTSNSKMRDVWEMWGKIPASFFTPKAEGEVDGHIVVSGIEAGDAEVHLIELNTNKDKEGNVIKPYEEDWAMKVPGRWYGRGPVEQVMFLQLWINTIVNIRINRSYVTQLGLWKIKRGANITPQNIQKLGANGAILVSSMDDIEQMVMQEASQSSYSDEANIRDIAKRITRTVETISGEKLPASTTATSASIQSAASKNPFIKIKERAGFWAERLINRHLMDKVVKGTKTGDVIRILSSDENIDEILERVAYYYVDKLQSDLFMADLYLNEQQLEIAMQSAKEQLKQRPELFIENLTQLVSSMVDATVYITNEELDMGSTVDKLVMGANLLPEQDRAPMVKVIFDTLGMPFPAEMSFNASKRQNMEDQMGQMMQGIGQQPQG